MTNQKARNGRIVGFALVAGAASLAFSVVSARSADLVTYADWSRKPTAQDLKEEYPRRARDEHVAGSAVIACRVTVEGDAADCVVQKETPEGYGFGAAAIEVLKRCKFHPATKNGVPVEQAVIRAPVNFGR